jgi:tetratricopeptide (TPR) repeat protein
MWYQKILWFFFQLSICSTRWKTTHRKGLRCREQGQYGEAIQDFRLALYRDPTHTTFLYYIGYCHFAQSRIQNAEQMWRLAKNEGLSSSGLHLGLGECSFQQELYEKAIEQYGMILTRKYHCNIIKIFVIVSHIVEWDFATFIYYNMKKQ